MSGNFLNPIPMNLDTFLKKNGINTVLSSTTPAPPSGSKNITWQSDQFGHISGNVPEVITQAGVSFQAVVTTPQNLASTAFTQLKPDTVIFDSASGFNLATGLYTVPISGTYVSTTKLRLADGSATPAGISYGQGMNTSAVDGPRFEWYTTQTDTLSSTTRQGSVNHRTVRLTVGQTVLLYYYVDYSSTVLSVINAEIDLCLVSIP